MKYIIIAALYFGQFATSLSGRLRNNIEVTWCTELSSGYLNEIVLHKGTSGTDNGLTCGQRALHIKGGYPMWGEGLK